MQIIRAYENRCFEYEVAKGLKNGRVNPPVYLSVGTEHIPEVLKDSLAEASVDDFAIFPQHRCHSYFLAFSQDKIEAMKSLRDELCGLSTGCGGGMSGSASLHIPGVMYGHSGFLGSNSSIACGFAHATGKKTICVLGDAGAEEDEALASLGYAATKNLNILFLCEDNDRSILTPKSVRRSWDLVNVARGFGLPAYNIGDGFNEMGGYFKSLLKVKGPTLLNIKCCRHLWHAGAGIDGTPEWDTLGEAIKVEKNLDEIQRRIESLWN